MNEVQSEIQKRKDKDKISKEQKELHSKWTKEQEELLAEWSEKASCYRWLHGRAEKKFRCRNYTFTIPVILGYLSAKISLAFVLFKPCIYLPAG